MTTAAAPHMHAAYWIPGYANPVEAGGVDLDPAALGVDTATLSAGAEIVVGRQRHGDPQVMLCVDLSNILDPRRHTAVAEVWLDDLDITDLMETVSYFCDTDCAESGEVGCMDEIPRVLNIGRLTDGDPLVYVRVDLSDTHGVAPTCWLDRAGLLRFREALTYLNAGRY